MEIQHLPIPVNPYPVPSSARAASQPDNKDNTDEQAARPVNEAERTRQENNESQNIGNDLFVLSQQQNQQPAGGGLQDSQVSFSAQQAVETYQDIASYEANAQSEQVLSRVDELV